MPRKSRNKSESNYYHVMVQGINKEYIFKDSYCINHYKSIILDKLKDSKINILAYCIMNNHAHFLIYSEKTEDLSKFMQRVNNSYSNFYNSNNKRVGYVFRDRYLSQDILSKNQLNNCLRYIHFNPIKANMVKKLDEYLYSSYNEFIGKKHIISEKSIEYLFGNNSEYIEEFKEIHNKDINDDFIDIKEKDIEAFIKEYEKINNKKIDEIIQEKIMLKDFIKEARMQTDVKVRELAEILGISKSTVCNYLK